MGLPSGTEDRPTYSEEDSLLKAAVLEAAKRLVVEDVDEPTWGEHDALIDVRASGVCGSDVHTYRGHHPFRRPPVVLGHEVAGTVIRIGDAVERVKVGDRVAVEPHIYCGECEFCARGLVNLCRNKRVPGVGWAGTFSERIVAPENVIHKLEDSVSFEEGAMLEPLAVAYRAFRTGGIDGESKVAVLGAGAIGSLVAHLCQWTGASELMVTDVKDYNLDFISSLGPCKPVNATETDTVEEGLTLTGGAGFDAVVITSGSRGSFTEAVRLCKPRGTVVAVALYPGEIPFDANLLVTREVTAQGCLTYTSDDFEDVVLLINKGKIDLKPFITERVGLDEAPEVFRRIDEGQDQIKVMIELGKDEGRARS